jgi:hypothetical protein
MSNNLFVTFGTMAGTEQLQTRTRTGANVTRYNRDAYVGETFTTQVREVRSSTCTEVFTGVTSTCAVKIYQHFNTTSCQRSCPACGTYNYGCTDERPTQCTPGAFSKYCVNIGGGYFNHFCCVDSNVTVCTRELESTGFSNCPCSTMGPCLTAPCDPALLFCTCTQTDVNNYTYSWSAGSWSTHSGSEPTGNTSCSNAGHVGNIKYDYRTSDVQSCQFNLIESLTNLISCTSDLRSCGNSNYSTPRYVCSSYATCVFGDWTSWVDTDTCNSTTPTCTNGALQRQCRIV